MKAKLNAHHNTDLEQSTFVINFNATESEHYEVNQWRAIASESRIFFAHTKHNMFLLFWRLYNMYMPSCLLYGMSTNNKTGN